MNRIPRRHYLLVREQVSTVSDSWAIADLIARHGFRLTIGDSTVLAVRIAQTEHWVVVDVGPDDYLPIGCGIAPNSVLADLFLDNIPCSGGDTS